jgi:hypothetical protein
VVAIKPKPQALYLHIQVTPYHVVKYVCGYVENSEKMAQKMRGATKANLQETLCMDPLSHRQVLSAFADPVSINRGWFIGYV